MCVVLALFFPAISARTWVMGFFGGDPAAPVIVDEQETFPLVPVAVGLFSIFFNVFNVLILFPFVTTFERVLSRIGRSDDDLEDYSIPKYLDHAALGDFTRAVPAMRQEVARTLQAGHVFLDIAARRVQREQFSPAGQAILDEGLGHLERNCRS